MADRRRRGILGLLAANGVSTLGTRMSMLAIPWFVLTTSGSAAETGLVAFAETAPYVLLMAIGGPWVDRLGAWRVAIASEIAAGVAMGAIPLLFLTGHLSLPLLAGLAAIAGGVRGAGDRATASWCRRWPTTRGCRSSAHPASSTASAARPDGGCPSAGLLIAASSAPAVIIIDAASFFVSGALILALVPRSSQPEAHPDELEAGYMERLGQGIATAWRSPADGDRADGARDEPHRRRWRLGSHAAVGAGAPGRPGRDRLISGVFGLGAVCGDAVLSWLAQQLPRRVGLRPWLPHRRWATFRRHGPALDRAADARRRLRGRVRRRQHQPDPRCGRVPARAAGVSRPACSARSGRSPGQGSRSAVRRRRGR